MASNGTDALRDLGKKNDDGQDWVGLAAFDEGEPSDLKVVVSFDSEADRDAFLVSIGATPSVIHKKTGPTWSLWWPLREREDLASLRSGQLGLTNGSDRTLPRYPVYVISKGRAATPLTARFLERDGVPFRIVVEPQEADEYAAAVGKDKVLILPFSNLGQGSIPARNWVWEHAVDQGAERHWILDDNIGQMRRLYHGRRIPCNSGPALWQAEEFVERYENVGIAGLNYQMFGFPGSPPYRANVHVYSCLLISNDLPFRWRGKYNEDTDLCLQAISGGFCTVLINAFLIDKKTTMTMKGGNTDLLYEGDGRLRMAQSLADAWPDVAKVTNKWGRPQHTVAWGNFGATEPAAHDGLQMTIDGREEPVNPSYGSPLRLREGLDLERLRGIRVEDGLDIHALNEVRSERLRELLEEATT